MPKAPVDTLTLTPESFEVQIHCEITPDPKSKEPLTQEFFERRLSALNESVQQFSQKPICLATRGRGNFDDDHWVEEMTGTGSVGIEKVTPDSLSLGAKVNSDFFFFNTRSESMQCLPGTLWWHARQLPSTAKSTFLSLKRPRMRPEKRANR